MRNAISTCSIFCFLALSSFVTPLYATLGEKSHLAQIKKEKVDTLKTRTLENYAVHELTESDGMTTREYVDNLGLVFAVSWTGRRHPDLTQILGSHYSVFQMHANALARTRAPVVVEVGNLKVLLGGHQRDFRGQAILNSMIPAGVEPLVLQ